MVKEPKNESLPHRGRLEGASTAILLGATGLTGRVLLQQLLEDSRYEKIILFSRRPSELNHPKIEEHIIDLFELETVQDKFMADEVYCCIGSTKKKTPDENMYRKIDYGIPVTAAKLTKKKNISTFLVISAIGADAESRFFYGKVKGEMEKDVLNEKIPNTYIFQPSLIAGERKEKRTFEFLAKEAMKLGNYLLLGPLKKYKSISPETIATAMITVAKNGYSKNRIESDEIQEIADKSKK